MMLGMARIVSPGLPHHVTQRGNRCEPASRWANTGTVTILF